MAPWGITKAEQSISTMDGLKNEKKKKKNGTVVSFPHSNFSCFPSKLLTDSRHLLTDSFTKREVMREAPLEL